MIKQTKQVSLRCLLLAIQFLSLLAQFPRSLLPSAKSLICLGFVYNTPVPYSTEIAFHDRGPLDADRMMMAGSWSVYWYNGVIVSSEIARGLDIFELTASDVMSQNEIDAAKSIRFDQLNSQGQPHFVWPHTFALAGAYVDQLERSRGLASARVASVREALAGAEGRSGSARRSALTSLASDLDADAGRSLDGAKVRLLADAVRGMASGG